MELIALAVLRGVVQLHRLRLERDAALALDRIVVENLRVHFTLFQSTGQLDETIGERRLAVVDMRDDAEIADVILRSEEHTSELQSLMRISYAVFCLKNKIQIHTYETTLHINNRKLININTTN